LRRDLSGFNQVQINNMSASTSALKRSPSAEALIEKRVRRLSEQNIEAAKRAAKEKDDNAPKAWWAVGAYVIFNHIVTLYAFFFYHTNWSIYMLMPFVYELTAIGITAGYHRLWSHRAYSANLPLRILLAWWGTMGFQGSIKWWALRHRLHHRYTDTDHDPYNSLRGFYYSHMGWLFEKPYYPRLKSIDQSDLSADPVVQFQHHNILPLLILVGVIQPLFLGWLCGDALGGLLWLGFVCRTLVWHATWCINSFAHWMGERLFSDTITARGNLLCGFITNGEGHHNFHHEFPRDYRNGVRWYDYDPTKWVIRAFWMLGMATGLHRASKNAMLQCRVQVSENRVAKTRARLQWGPQPHELPEMTMAEVEAKVANEKADLIIIGGFVLDFSEFKSDHPGGSKLLIAYRGRDATAAFEGGANIHTVAAHNLAAMYRIARISKDNYVADQ